MRYMKNICIRIANSLLPTVVKVLNLSNVLGSSKTAIQQKQLMMTYKSMYHSKMPCVPMRDVGFRVHSQYDEDGMLLFVFALIGTTNRKCVEICSGDGVECNVTNLVVNHGWEGMLCEGDPLKRQRARKFFYAHPNTRSWPPAIVGEWVMRENVNQLIADQNYSGEIDLLSLDMDGMDYWIWKEITQIKPRVVILEFNHLLGPERAVTVPYESKFVAEFTKYGADYSGASLAAFNKLAKEKGYRLVGVNNICTNALFVRNDIENDWLPEIEVDRCFSHSRAAFGMNTRFEEIKDKAWQEV